jgi:hypothetical protein
VLVVTLSYGPVIIVLLNAFQCVDTPSGPRMRDDTTTVCPDGIFACRLFKPPHALNTGDEFWAFGGVTAGFGIGLPLLYIYFLKSNKKRLNMSAFSSMFGPMYEVGLLGASV